MDMSILPNILFFPTKLNIRIAHLLVKELRFINKNYKKKKKMLFGQSLLTFYQFQITLRFVEKIATP